MAVLSIIPKPVKMKKKMGFFILNKDTILSYDKELESIAGYFREFIIQSTGFTLNGSSQTEVINSIKLIIDSSINLDDEGYLLNVSEKSIEIKAKAIMGIFYGIQTLRQLLPSEVEEKSIQTGIKWEITCIEIEDYPRFKWRGLMLDVCRHFFDVNEIKKLLDVMALQKLNTFHWHLTEDQGWRIEIKKYPKLTEIGSKRKETQLKNTRSKIYDGIPHEGFYTQEEIKDVIAYAQNLFITIVPEIEIPGHSQAAIAAYPEFSCFGEKFEVCTKFGVIRIVYCPGKEKVFQFWRDVLDEVIELFPSKIIHTGGDECPKERWEKCPDCQAKIKKEGLKDEEDLQVYVTNSLASYLASKGRRLMGWNEILDDGLELNAVCHYWTGGDNKIIDHIKKGRDVVVSRSSHLYLNSSYKGMPLKKTYSYEPMLEGLNKEDEKHILGMEAPLWAEWVPDNDTLEWQIFPRLTAAAETSWTQKNLKNFDDFKLRLSDFEKRLSILSINYAPESEQNPTFISKIKKLFSK